MARDEKNAEAFRAAVSQACERITQEDIALACGRSVNAVTRALINGGPLSRAPPPDWRTAIARLLRDRARQDIELAERLEGD